MPVTKADLEKRFDYHPPGSNKVKDQFGTIRFACKELAETVVTLVPEGREQSTALTKIEEAMMWANAGIARNQP